MEHDVVLIYVGFFIPSIDIEIVEQSIFKRNIFYLFWSVPMQKNIKILIYFILPMPWVLIILEKNFRVAKWLKICFVKNKKRLKKSVPLYIF